MKRTEIMDFRAALMPVPLLLLPVPAGGAWLHVVHVD